MYMQYSSTFLCFKKSASEGDYKRPPWNGKYMTMKREKKDNFEELMNNCFKISVEPYFSHQRPLDVAKSCVLKAEIRGGLTSYVHNYSYRKHVSKSVI